MNFFILVYSIAMICWTAELARKYWGPYIKATDFLGNNPVVGYLRFYVYYVSCIMFPLAPLLVFRAVFR